MILLSLSLMVASAVAPVPVAFWRTGDDGLSLRFYGEIERAIARDGRIREAVAGDVGVSFTLYAETNVHPLTSDSDHFSYRISLRAGPSFDAPLIARLDSRCVDDIPECAADLVARVADRIARRAD
ncbi:hypothetical protein [Sphingopyxis macrogoltabida]|uniref:Uncharacterized protein n=1 Tax=Sphingopyxis macrogoltabida TaxID=33050 RepID=A0AAC8Z0H6_SPHMC|nr:hypothetical protein [Sphingopyxis macrogoltabida]ALJ13202.1 hypothetical protein LH19_10020 [Sphingopyxis macrogoltabida]AMU89332.1 hypothetical protein ATM17_09815 [Sphingopyxis macrogoltabida]